MRNLNRQQALPNEVRRTNRVHPVRELTSLPAGKVVPLAAIPLFREDSVRRGSLELNFEMMETYELLLNQTSVKVSAWLWPNLAAARFQGSMDIFNRSFNGIAPLEGEAVIPFFEWMEFRREVAGEPVTWEDREIFRYMGAHGNNDGLVITDYIEAYNSIQNFRLKNRSDKLDLRELDDDTLAEAFWRHTQFDHIVTDYDDVALEGEVPLFITGFSNSAPVVGLDENMTVHSTGDGTDRAVITQPDSAERYGLGSNPSAFGFARWGNTALEADLTELAEELSSGAIRLSLANIELAKKARTMAKIREKYDRIDEEWVIDMLMGGLSVPEQALRQPMMLAQSTVPFRQAKRYASDSGNLTESVTNGMARTAINFRVPRLSTGGIIMILAEAVPDQLFERQVDPYLHMSKQPYEDGSEYPEYQRDWLDPHKVEIVTNKMIDVDHTEPEDVFGYAPLNHRWNSARTNVGGRYYWPDADAEGIEARKRIWASEVENPTFGPDFMLVSELNTDVFVVTDQDPFEVVTTGAVIINGNTVFGRGLTEASDNYDKIMEKVPPRIEKPEDDE